MSKVISLKRSGLFKNYYNERAMKRIRLFFFILLICRFVYMVKTGKINPLPYISQIMSTEEGRMLMQHFLFCNNY
jgi:hypothetical protein